MSSARKKRSSTTQLPAALQEELGIASVGGQSGGASQKRYERAAMFASLRGSQRGRGGGGKRALGRKEMRKVQREEKKSARRGRSTKNDGRDVRTKQENNKSHARLLPTHTSSALASVRSEKAKGKAKVEDGSNIQAREERVQLGQRKNVSQHTETPLERLLRQSARQNGRDDEEGQTSTLRTNGKRTSKEDEGDGSSRRKRPKNASLTSVEQNEEDEIAWLEAHVGKRSEEEDDGLDELLGDLDRFQPGMHDDYSEDDYSEDEYSEDDEDEHFENSDDDDDEQEDDEYEEVTEESLQASDSEEEKSNDRSDVRSLHNDEDDIVEEAKSIQDKSDDASQLHHHSPQEGRYIPPAVRKRMEAEQGQKEGEELVKLRRSVKGLLNRLGDNSIANIVLEAEGLYRQYSRAQTTSTLTNVILDTIVAGGERLNESFMVLYGAFVCSLHRIVGVEFGAHFVQETVDRFLKHYETARSADQSNDEDDVSVGKEARNLVVLLAALYNLDVIGCPLVYDVIKLVLGNEQLLDAKQTQSRPMTELDVELLLTIVKSCGTQLRHDDPTSLKAIVHLANERQTNKDAVPSMRSKFMLESLSDLRNNRSRATTANAATELVTKMRKFLGGLTKKHTVRTVEPLRIGLHDLRNVDRRGKWWLVGAAWAGYEFASSAEGKEEETQSHQQSTNDVALLDLARQHGMNTALRQQIFVTLLSSEDYLDAVQRLLALTHKRQTQRREIVRVLLHCLGVEKNFNPFYVVVGAKLANEDPTATRITLQYCLWDFLRRLGEQGVGGQSIVSSAAARDEEEEETDTAFDEHGGTSDTHVNNVARAYGWWIAKGALGLDALRAVDFTALRRRGESFIQRLFVHLFLSTSVSSPVQTLSAVATSSSSASETRQSIERVFIHGTRTNQRVAQGILVFLETHLQAKHCRRLANEIGLKGDSINVLVQARSAALETVRVGARVAANDDVDIE